MGSRVKALRAEQSLSLREFAARSGLSLRFASQLDKGQANISIERLERVADALGVSLASLVEPARGRVVALLGLRGAGKSTLGARLAERLDLVFVELDERIEEAAGLGLSEMTMGGQFGVQLTGVVAVLVWSGVATLVLAKILQATVGLRASDEEETEGLDIVTHGERGYEL